MKVKIWFLVLQCLLGKCFGNFPEQNLILKFSYGTVRSVGIGIPWNIPPNHASDACLSVFNQRNEPYNSEKSLVSKNITVALPDDSNVQFGDMVIEESQQLKFSQFRILQNQNYDISVFSFPQTVIKGVEVLIWVHSDSLGVVEKRVFWELGVPLTTDYEYSENKAKQGLWLPANYTFKKYGSATDLWDLPSEHWRVAFDQTHEPAPSFLLDVQYSPYRSHKAEVACFQLNVNMSTTLEPSRSYPSETTLRGTTSTPVYKQTKSSILHTEHTKSMRATPSYAIVSQSELQVVIVTIMLLMVLCCICFVSFSFLRYYKRHRVENKDFVRKDIIIGEYPIRRSGKRNGRRLHEKQNLLNNSNVQTKGVIDIEQNNTYGDTVNTVNTEQTEEIILNPDFLKEDEVLKEDEDSSVNGQDGSSSSEGFLGISSSNKQNGSTQLTVVDVYQMITEKTVPIYDSVDPLVLEEYESSQNNDENEKDIYIPVPQARSNDNNNNNKTEN